MQTDNGNTDVTLTAYLGGDVPDGTVSFSLGGFTGTSFELPGTTSNGDDSTGYDSRHVITGSLGNERVGAFRCSVEQDGESTNTIVPIVAQNGKCMLLNNNN